MTEEGVFFVDFWKSKQKIVKITAVLFGFMLVCTLISKSVYAYSLPQITAEAAKKRMVGRQITVYGTVTQSREYAVSTIPAVKVESVEVGRGDEVEEGALLFTLDMEDLKKQIAQQELAIKKLEVQIAALQYNQGLENEERVLVTNRLLEDYLDTASENDIAIERARIREKEAQQDLQKHLEDAPAVTDSEGREAAWQEYEAWLERGACLQEEVDRLTKELAAAEQKVQDAQAELDAARQAAGVLFSRESVSEAEDSFGAADVAGNEGSTADEDNTDSPDSAAGIGSTGNADTPDSAENEENADAPNGGAEEGDADMPGVTAEESNANIPGSTADEDNADIPDSAGAESGNEAADGAGDESGSEAAAGAVEDSGSEAPDNIGDEGGVETTEDQSPGLSELQERLEEAVAERDACAASLENARRELAKHESEMKTEPDFTAEDTEQKNWESQSEALRRNAESADWAYQDAQRQKEKELQEAQRKVDDSVAPRNIQDALALEQLELSYLKEVLREYQNLESLEGKVTAPQNGIVTAVNVMAGNDAPDGAAVVYANREDNLEFRMTLTEEEQKYINQGTQGNLKIGSRQENYEVAYMEQQSDGRYMAVIPLPEGVGNIGANGIFNVFWQSEAYPCCVLIDAVHEENQRKYIYVVRRQQGILGEELTAEKRFVTVCEEGDSVVALDNFDLAEDEEVILSSTKELTDGAVVRYRLAGSSDIE